MNETDKHLIKRMKQLARKECANCYDSFCVQDDCPCHLISSRYPSIRDGAIDCDWFLLWVLPLQPDLQRDVWTELLREEGQAPQTLKNCVICGRPFLPASNRQKYCSACQITAQRARGREKQRRYEANKKAGQNLTV